MVNEEDFQNKCVNHIQREQIEENLLINDDNSIKSFYKDTTIFITGATGFLGKALIEKLLRSCEDLKSIYILIRSKRGQNGEQRYHEFLRHQVFDRLRSEKPHAFKKLHYLAGDITQPRLGLNEHDLNFLLENVSIVFHSAATIKFNEGLKEAANMNACGTQKLLDLCLKMSNLKSIIHVSTAFCNPGRKYVGETVYPSTTPMDKDSFMKFVTILPSEILNLITDQLMGPHPNTYTLTKSIAEQIVLEYNNILPISIIRPSIIVGAIREPHPGWIDNVQGITGIMMEVGRGTITSIVGDRYLNCDIIPLDTVVNTMIGAAWLTGTLKFHQIQVFNCTSGQIRPITWQKLSEYTLKWARLYPSKYLMLYPNCAYRTNELMHKIYVFIYQMLPAFLYDQIFKLQGMKPLNVKFARKIRDTLQIGKFFSLHQWDFETTNQRKLTKMIRSTKDSEEFDCSIENLEYDHFIKTCMLGIRKYILKDGEESLEKARRKCSNFYYIKIFMRGVFILFVCWIIHWIILS